LANEGLKLGSLIVTESNVVVAFSKESVAIERKGTMGVDVNERNVTWSDSSGESKVEDTSRICEVKELYNDTKARIARRTYKDRRNHVATSGQVWQEAKEQNRSENS
jgi:hypothetical protein